MPKSRKTLLVRRAGLCDRALTEAVTFIWLFSKRAVRFDSTEMDTVHSTDAVHASFT